MQSNRDYQTQITNLQSENKKLKERLETLERNSDKVIKDSVKLINRNLELQQENEKLKKAISLLNLLFNFDIDIETETIYCCLGDVSVNGANLYEDFKLLKEVLGEWNLKNY